MVDIPVCLRPAAILAMAPSRAKGRLAWPFGKIFAGHVHSINSFRLKAFSLDWRAAR